MVHTVTLQLRPFPNRHLCLFVFRCLMQRKTLRCVTSWWVATTSTCKPLIIPPLPGERSSCVSLQPLTTPLRWWNTLLVRGCSMFQSKVNTWPILSFVLRIVFLFMLTELLSVFPLQRGWCTHGRRWAWTWSLTHPLSVRSASSRCTLSWWAIEKSLTSVASATQSQPAHNTTPQCWLETAHLYSTSFLCHCHRMY